MRKDDNLRLGERETVSRGAGKIWWRRLNGHIKTIVEESFEKTKKELM